MCVYVCACMNASLCVYDIIINQGSADYLKPVAKKITGLQAILQVSTGLKVFTGLHVLTGFWNLYGQQACLTSVT